MPGSGERLVSLREDAATTLRIHPLGALSVKQNVTLGEICDLFRSELGEYRDPAYL